MGKGTLWLFATLTVLFATRPIYGALEARFDTLQAMLSLTELFDCIVNLYECRESRRRGTLHVGHKGGPRVHRPRY